MDPLVLDTNSFRNTDFLFWLRSYNGQKILPVIADVELGVFFESQGEPLDKVQSLLNRTGVTIEWFRPEDGRVAIQTAGMTKDFSENARDHLIGAHAASPPRHLVTENIDDFTFLGDRVLTPRDAMKAY